jgi:hypothetical protein
MGWLSHRRMGSLSRRLVVPSVVVAWARRRVVACSELSIASPEPRADTLLRCKRISELSAEHHPSQLSVRRQGVGAALAEVRGATPMMDPPRPNIPLLIHHQFLIAAGVEGELVHHPFVTTVPPPSLLTMSSFLLPPSPLPPPDGDISVPR